MIRAVRVLKKISKNGITPKNTIKSRTSASSICSGDSFNQVSKLTTATVTGATSSC